jgi:hypothetical protein
LDPPLPIHPRSGWRGGGFCAISGKNEKRVFAADGTEPLAHFEETKHSRSKFSRASRWSAHQPPKLLQNFLQIVNQPLPPIDNRYLLSENRNRGTRDDTEALRRLIQDHKTSVFAPRINLTVRGQLHAYVLHLGNGLHAYYQGASTVPALVIDYHTGRPVSFWAQAA